MRRALLFLLCVACSEPFAPIEPPLVVEDASPPDASTPDAPHDEHEAGAACETIGRTGAADTCLLFATCGHRRFELDCSARFTCLCSEPDVDGGPTKQIAAQPAFCESPSSDLRPAFEAARRACAW